MKPEEAIFRDFLRAKGLKLTGERMALLDAIADVPHHFEVDDLIATARSRNSRISKATVYRTLTLLVDCGLLDRIHFGQRSPRYERLHGVDHHDHLVCIGCGEIVEFIDPEIERQQELACKELGFQPSWHRHQLFGHCGRCKQERKGRHGDSQPRAGTDR